MSAVSLRPFLQADARRCAEIFRSSIDVLAAEDYDEDQRAAWASRADDEQAFGARLTGALTLIATIDGAAAGFASLKGADEIDMLFVDPEFARQGVGRTLVDALTRLAQARGAKRLTTQASDSAKPLVRAPGLRASAAQSRPRRRPMARQHHNGEDTGRRFGASNATLRRAPWPQITTSS